MKLELLTNATVVDDAMKFVSERQQHQKEEPIKKIIIESADDGKKHDNILGQQEWNNEDINTITKNQVF